MARGFWSGAREGLSNIRSREEAAKDRAARREEFMMNLIEKRKSIVLPELMERLGQRRAKIKKTQANVESFMNYDFSKETALALHASGQLSSTLGMLSKLTEKGDLSFTYKKTLEDLAKKYAKNNPDKFAKIMQAGIAEETGSQNKEIEALMNVINSNTEEDMLAGMAEISSMARRDPVPAIQRFMLNPAKMVALTQSEIESMNDDITEGIASTTGDQYFEYTQNPDGGVYRTTKDADMGVFLRSLFNATRNIAEAPTGIYKDYNINDATEYVLGQFMDDFRNGMTVQEAIPQINQALTNPNYILKYGIKNDKDSPPTTLIPSMEPKLPFYGNNSGG